MPDRTDDRTSRSAQPEDVRVKIDLPADLLGRCKGRHPEKSLRCRHHDGHQGPHESGTGVRWWGEPYPPRPVGADAENVVLRHTFRAQLSDADAETLERTAHRMAGAANEVDDISLDFPKAMEAAAADLDAVALFLHYWADDGDDGLTREHIPAGAAALEIAPLLRRQAARLRERLAAGAGNVYPADADPPADLPEPPECAEVERDRPALREVYARQLRVEERETLERLADNLLELSREGSPAVRAVIHCGALDAEVAALAADLRHAERFLRVLGAQEGNVLERWESRLADAALQLAEPVAEAARQLERAVAEVAP